LLTNIDRIGFDNHCKSAGIAELLPVFVLLFVQQLADLPLMAPLLVVSNR